VRAGCRHAKDTVVPTVYVLLWGWTLSVDMRAQVDIRHKLFHPPGGDWQIIYRHGSSIESVIRKAWSIARETESRQAVAIGEAVFADVGDAGWAVMLVRLAHS